MIVTQKKDNKNDSLRNLALETDFFLKNKLNELNQLNKINIIIVIQLSLPYAVFYKYKAFMFTRQ